jgi:two-component system cell cycle response regulator
VNADASLMNGFPLTNRHRVRMVSLAVCAACVAAYALWLATGADWLVGLMNNGVYNGVIVAAAFACFAQTATVRAPRKAWVALGLGLLSWAAGNIYWDVALANLRPIPYPSPADAGYLGVFPCFYVGIVLLIKARVGYFTAARWLDGLIGALATGALATAFLAPVFVGLTNGGASTELTNIAYPLGDLLLIALIAGAVITTGWHGAGALLFIGVGLIVWSFGDIAYLYEEATGSYVYGWMDMTWLVGSLMIGAATLQRVVHRPSDAPAYRPSILSPVVASTLAVGILAWDHFARLHPAAIALSCVTLAAVLVRLRVSFRLNSRLLDSLQDESNTDALTGLGNRRKLLSDLDHALAAGEGNAGSNRVFALFDLDGFKSYNDTFGHPAGDALLARLGGRLAAALPSDAHAYRLGGDEFCFISQPGIQEPKRLVSAGRAALTETGKGFSIGASAGAALIPEEASSPSASLSLVDKRMYAEKTTSAGRIAQQTRELLRASIREDIPGLDSHQHDVAELAVAVATELGFDGEDLDVLRRAAEFHDVGKLGIPAEILDKPGPLEPSEWDLMRTHTLIGGRLLSHSQAMVPVAEIVRASHERWDGAGYPNGLAGEEIPLASRIIFACDALCAMTATRSYREAMPVEAALAELRAHAGTQFDPRIVATIERVIEARPSVAQRWPVLAR